MKYVGITIGPIFKTIGEAISPAGLWFGSYFFSTVTKKLCEKLVEIPNVKIFSPFYNSNSNQNPQEDGIGRYHDRILFSVDGNTVTEEKLQKIISAVKKEMAGKFGKFNSGQIENFINNYLRIDFVILNEETINEIIGKSGKAGNNIAIILNDALDALELMAAGKGRTDMNLFAPFFAGQKGNRNIYIKKSKLFTDTKPNSQLVIKHPDRDSDLKAIEDIALSRKKEENSSEEVPDGEVAPTRSEYYAVVNSDGDKVGTLLKALCKDLEISKQSERINIFSRACLDYAGEAAKLVGKYGGMTIYAGGDDLLFIAPVHSLLSLCSELDEMFKKTLKKGLEEVDLPDDSINVSLSFGVAVQYVKYPLYEALERARVQLYKAKESCGNRLGIELVKHSGKTVQLMIENEKLDVIDGLIKYRATTNDQALESVLYNLQDTEIIFRLLFEKTGQNIFNFQEYKMRFLNNFNNPNQLSYHSYLNEIAKFFYDNYLKYKPDTKEKVDGVCTKRNISIGEFYTKELQAILFLVKFWQGGK
ncbi:MULTISPECIES: type III-B CRISPR-associated protein Cas10/Cmr2 [Streptococcus]|jgi:CRISPR-associated protein, cmr2 family|uniref:CRISPR-associated protein n=1 Tax=Streptococcus mitis TaxID=28037 RepID=A0A3R9JFT7_STRMT|nr:MULTISPECIES: type III-B CRISPR-associated protein Cas10/Cmr2 [Streptococcus]MCY7076190.1 type III-B CRISPR-associated protein Cas10/Cmr2 [Streptococcus oralis]RSI79239.1 CRISPR-associated protein [Streptococcus mitis]